MKMKMHNFHCSSTFLGIISMDIDIRNNDTFLPIKESNEILNIDKNELNSNDNNLDYDNISKNSNNLNSITNNGKKSTINDKIDNEDNENILASLIYNYDKDSLSVFNSLENIVTTPKLGYKDKALLNTNNSKKENNKFCNNENNQLINNENDFEEILEYAFNESQESFLDFLSYDDTSTIPLTQIRKNNLSNISGDNSFLKYNINDDDTNRNSLMSINKIINKNDILEPKNKLNNSNNIDDNNNELILKSIMENNNLFDFKDILNDHNKNNEKHPKYIDNNNIKCNSLEINKTINKDIENKKDNTDISSNDISSNNMVNKNQIHEEDHSKNVIDLLNNINNYIKNLNENTPQFNYLMYSTSNINLSNNMQKIIVENYFKYCEIIHKTNIDIFLILPNKELSKFNLDIANVKDILTRYGKGLKRIGKCPCCPQQPGVWYKTKTSAYSYHLSSSHGISPYTFSIYNKPSKYRLTIFNKYTNQKEQIEIPSTTKKYTINEIDNSDNKDITTILWPIPHVVHECIDKEGYCEKCNKWIKLETNTINTKKVFKHWWKHEKLVIYNIFIH
ncbi:hypothetical protein U3516DRAFT_866768 [Neocallimastix sp. 'constans']